MRFLLTIISLATLATAGVIFSPDAPTEARKVEMTALEARADIVSIQYCKEKNYADCETRNSFSGDCVSLSPDFNDRTQSVVVPANTICVFWDKYSCQKDHTGTFQSQAKPDMKNWNNKISSYRCCAGTKWCGDGL
ncbi:hypothetical protein COCSADRAFT_181176 [Bipolaris sorokiniana ND90Pr]|uniref:Small secreted protein n=1 Tax=Cochliobolus sativus (strain ND90Pr / ATCC 201652) TaxID=665912 RepID=M2SNW1_COCSN|nr:uncharacterized protein COCSADRAFT_181176 [Bipolaris sorokiniana ND90Pr]EMD63985.1 hypothetical protein COCSADRAFT_181176 [Bipolaris sorokiniana ND90Pr]